RLTTLVSAARGSVRRSKTWAVGRIGPDLAFDWYQRTTEMRGTLAARRREAECIEAARAQLARLPEARVVTVIPTYQRPELLRRAVASAQAQTVVDHAIVVVNDGGSLPELRTDERLACITLPVNVGIAGVVRNVGIALSRSEYLAFLDDDNEWRPNHLYLCLGGFRPGVDLVYSAVMRVRPDGTELDVISWPFDRSQLRRQRSVDTSSIVVRRGRGATFSRVPRNSKSLEDWELVWRFSRRHGVLHVPEVTVRYLVNPETYYSRWSPDDLAGK
ncbi:MAG: glycosyltransferase family 2 protein, partial [Acidimicrobiales bacterium]